MPPTPRQEHSHKYIRENVSEDVDVIITDDFAAYPFHETSWSQTERIRRLSTAARFTSMGDIHTNTVENAFSLLKRGIMGTWHRLSSKHLAAYLDEMWFRFNRRKRPDLFMDTLRHMVTAPVLHFKNLQM